jgi:uncharacterized protein (PEP-CTERM system associated)
LLTNLLLTRAIRASTNQEFAFYEATLARLRLTQQFTQRLSALVEGAFELDEFQDRVRLGEPTRRDDRLYGFGVGGDYLFARWLTAGLFYQYQMKDSDVALDYVVNRVFLRMTLRF